MTTIIQLPKMSPNDEEGRLVAWAVEPGEHVSPGQLICEIETSKATVEVEAEASGYFHPVADLDQMLPVGAPLAVLLENPGDPMPALPSIAATEEVAAAEGAREVRTTRKAEIVAKRLGIDIAQIAAGPSGVVREQDVLAAAGATKQQPLSFPANGVARPAIERVAVIGSVSGGGAAIVVDILLRSRTQICCGIYDQDATLSGKDVLGVPILGSSDADQLVAEWKQGRFDSVIIAFNRNLEARRTLFDELQALGVPFANAIDETVNVRSGVSFGVGNVIAGSSYIGAEARIGNNNFISSNVCIEHHCSLGSHCGFGPGVTFSGRVVVGDTVRFGTQIAAEPGITIGDGAVIASSTVLTNDVPPRSVVRARQSRKSEL